MDAAPSNRPHPVRLAAILAIFAAIVAAPFVGCQAYSALQEARWEAERQAWLASPEGREWRAKQDADAAERRRVSERQAALAAEHGSIYAQCMHPDRWAAYEVEAGDDVKACAPYKGVVAAPRYRMTEEEAVSACRAIGETGFFEIGPCMERMRARGL